MNNLGKCRSCGARVKWIRTPKGKNMPVDLDPIFVDCSDPNPNAMVVTRSGKVVRGRKAEPPLKNTYTLGYVSHFATCPQANRHRKNREQDSNMFGGGAL